MGCGYWILLFGVTQTYLIMGTLAGLVISNCQDMYRTDVQLTFSFDFKSK